MVESFLGKRILIFTAHPDDEAFLAAGTIFQNGRQGGKTMLVCATHGENGRSHLAKSITKAAVKAMRAKELRQVKKLLNIHLLKILQFSDGKLSNAAKKLAKEFQALAAAFKPEVILSFGPDGVTGHLDHVAVAEAAKLVADNLGCTHGMFVPPPAFIRHLEEVKSRRKHGVYKDEIIFPKSNLKIAIDTKIKMKALLLHKSQLANQDPFNNLPIAVKKQVLQYEYFLIK